MKVVAIVYLFAKLASLCLPSVSPLSPLLALCLLFSLLALACSCCLAWFPLLLHRWKLLSLTVLKRMRKRVATKEFVKRLRGSVSQNLISDLVWTSFAPRSDLVKIAASQNPEGFAMVCCLVCCCCCCCCLCCCFWARRGFWAEKQEICERAGSFCLPQWLRISPLWPSVCH